MKNTYREQGFYDFEMVAEIEYTNLKGKEIKRVFHFPLNKNIFIGSVTEFEEKWERIFEDNDFILKTEIEKNKGFFRKYDRANVLCLMGENDIRGYNFKVKRYMVIDYFRNIEDCNISFVRKHLKIKDMENVSREIKDLL